MISKAMDIVKVEGWPPDTPKSELPELTFPQCEILKKRIKEELDIDSPITEVAFYFSNLARR